MNPTTYHQALEAVREQIAKRFEYYMKEVPDFELGQKGDDLRVFAEIIAPAMIPVVEMLKESGVPAGEVIKLLCTVGTAIWQGPIPGESK